MSESEYWAGKKAEAEYCIQNKFGTVKNEILPVLREAANFADYMAKPGAGA